MKQKTNYSSYCSLGDEIEQATTGYRAFTTGVHSEKLIRRAKIILALDTSGGRKLKTYSKIAENNSCSIQTVYNIKNDFLAAENIESFLQIKKRKKTPIEPKITGEVEAHIIALACTESPEGFTKWSTRLLADKTVELGYIEKISHMSISRVLKKHHLNLT